MCLIRPLPNQEDSGERVVDQRYLSSEEPNVYASLRSPSRGQCGTHHALDSPNIMNPSCYAFAQVSASGFEFLR
jgi:hypothetical protein